MNKTKVIKPTRIIKLENKKEGNIPLKREEEQELTLYYDAIITEQNRLSEYLQNR